MSLIGGSFDRPSGGGVFNDARGGKLGTYQRRVYVLRLVWLISLLACDMFPIALALFTIS